jgi:hypothetical protein
MDSAMDNTMSELDFVSEVLTPWMNTVATVFTSWADGWCKIIPGEITQGNVFLVPFQMFFCVKGYAIGIKILTMTYIIQLLNKKFKAVTLPAFGQTLGFDLVNIFGIQYSFAFTPSNGTGLERFGYEYIETFVVYIPEYPSMNYISGIIGEHVDGYKSFIMSRLPQNELMRRLQNLEYGVQQKPEMFDWIAYSTFINTETNYNKVEAQSEIREPCLAFHENNTVFTGQLWINALGGVNALCNV